MHSLPVFIVIGGSFGPRYLICGHWIQVLGAAINVDPNKRERAPSRLIEMLSNSHSKVLACVIWGRLKNAFQIASRSESASDVQYVAREVSTQPTLVLINYVLNHPPQGSCFGTLGH
jgi:hypothetical protein